MIFPKEWSTHKKLLFAMGLAGKAIEDTATGNPVTFETDLAKPLKSLVANFLPIQSGTGDPSPTNIRPITGWTGLDVMHGADQTDYDTYPVTWTTHGTIYGGYVDLVTGEVWRTWKGVDLGLQSWAKRSENQNRQVWEAYFSDAKFETYMSAAYQANAKCSEFDLTTSNGSWTVGKFAPAMEGQKQVFIFVFPPNSFSTGTECAEAMDGVQLAYELASPVLITTLTPQQINAIKGNNTMWSDGNGDCEVTYLKKG